MYFSLENYAKFIKKHKNGKMKKNSSRKTKFLS